MSPNVNTPGFLSQPFGMDYPKELHSQLKRRHHCAVSVSLNGSSDHVHGSLKICLDSQQPRLDIRIGSAHVIFPATHTGIELVTKGVSKKTDLFIQAKQNAALPDIKADYTACFFELSPSAKPIFVGPSWKLTPEELIQWNTLQKIEWPGKKVFIWIAVPTQQQNVAKEIGAYMTKILTVVRESFTNREHEAQFWFAERNRITEKEAVGRRPKMPWLFDTKGGYNAVHAPDPFFLDDRDRRERLVEAARIEQYVLCTMYKKVFHDGQKHQATLELVVPREKTWKLHIWMNTDPMPAPPEGSQVNYKIDGLLGDGHGLCIGSGLSDFAILTRASLSAAHNGDTVHIELSLNINLKSSNAQIQALTNAGQAISFGDSTTARGNGFSLKRTILAHGSELDSRSPHYFKLNAKECSKIPADQKRERVNYILDKFPLDESQRVAVEMALFKAVCGIHLIKGPSGNGKTHTMLVMMLILASLELNVLICAGSNAAVDNILHRFHSVVRGDKRLRAWCGMYCRFRSSAYQMAALRRACVDGRLNHWQRQGPTSPIEQHLQDCQVESLVVKLAMEPYSEVPQNPAQEEARNLIKMLDSDRQRTLGREERKALASSYARILTHIVGSCRIVATTLDASGEEALRSSQFAPFAMLCDNAGQCLEGDTMIAMNWNSLRLVSLFGDTNQIQPNVVSSRENEWAEFHGRSLMARLEWCYPLTILGKNHRSHPDILAWSADTLYREEITASPRNSALDRVGKACDDFTSSRRHFKDQGLVGKRRVVINAPGKAFQPAGSNSWQNEDHIDVVICLLRAMYAHGSAGHRIQPEDVMIICPYQAQVRRTVERLGSEGVLYSQCLTVDAAHGLESNVVIFMFTKPSTDSVTEVGFLSDYRRLNVALTRAKKLLLVLGNLEIWNASFVKAAKTGSSRYLARFLEHVATQRDILKWVGPETVTSGLRPQQTTSPRRPTALLQAHTEPVSLDSALAADKGYSALLAQEEELELEKGQLGRARAELDASIAVNSERIADTARRLEEYERAFRRKWEREHHQ